MPVREVKPVDLSYERFLGSVVFTVKKYKYFDNMTFSYRLSVLHARKPTGSEDKHCLKSVNNLA